MFQYLKSDAFFATLKPGQAEHSTGIFWTLVSCFNKTILRIVVTLLKVQAFISPLVQGPRPGTTRTQLLFMFLTLSYRLICKLPRKGTWFYVCYLLFGVYLYLVFIYVNFIKNVFRCFHKSPSVYNHIFSGLQMAEDSAPIGLSEAETESFFLRICSSSVKPNVRPSHLDIWIPPLALFVIYMTSA